HDHGHDHRPGYHSRARTWHDGKSSIDADPTKRSAHRKNRALQSSRLHPGLGHSDRRPPSLSRAYAGKYSASAAGRARLHYREPRNGDHLFHDREKPTASRADGFLRFSPVDLALRFYVSVPWNAALGPNGRRRIPAHSFSSHRSRHSVERQRRHRRQPPALADRTLRSHRSDDRHQALPTNVGLGIRDLDLALRFFALLFRKKIGCTVAAAMPRGLGLGCEHMLDVLVC